MLSSTKLFLPLFSLMTLLKRVAACLSLLLAAGMEDSRCSTIEAPIVTSVSSSSNMSMNSLICGNMSPRIDASDSLEIRMRMFRMPFCWIGSFRILNSTWNHFQIVIHIRILSSEKIKFREKKPWLFVGSHKSLS